MGINFRHYNTAVAEQQANASWRRIVQDARRNMVRSFGGSQGHRCRRSAARLWALTANEMNECYCLKPELVTQIEFTEGTPDGHLRHSKFVGLREDKEAGGVVREPGS